MMLEVPDYIPKCLSAGLGGLILCMYTLYCTKKKKDLIDKLRDLAQRRTYPFKGPDQSTFEWITGAID